MKVLLLADKRNWAYDSIAQSLLSQNTRQNLSLSIMYTKGDIDRIKKKYKKYDRVFLMGWQTWDRVKFIDKKIMLTGLHSHHSWDEKKTTPENDVEPPDSLLKLLSQFAGVNAVSKRLWRLFSNKLKVNYTPNGVNATMFGFSPSPEDFTIGYSGSIDHDWRKGITEFIIPACKKAKCKLKVAMPGKNYVKLNEMPDFYRGISSYLCASSSEGFSLSMLEAASCGKPVITTPVGGTEELIIHGRNGFIVKRNVNDMADHIVYLKNNPDILEKLSKQIREDVINKHSWKIAAEAWFDFMENS